MDIFFIIDIILNFFIKKKEYQNNTIINNINNLNFWTDLIIVLPLWLINDINTFLLKTKLIN